MRISGKAKQLSNPFSTGGGGGHFEAHIQASFVLLMLSGGFAPCLPCWPITQIKLQGRVDGYNTDDLIVVVENPDTNQCCKLLGQVKHSINITKGDSTFSEVIQAAWSDFNTPHVFTKGNDSIALITGPLNRTDQHTVQWLLNQARHTTTSEEFFRRVEEAKFSPPKSAEKLAVFEHHLKQANGDCEVPREILYSFLRHFHVLGYDLGTEFGVVLSLLHSHISQFNTNIPEQVWSRVVDVVQSWNQDAGTVTRENLPGDLIEAFKPAQPNQVHIPEELTRTQSETAHTDWSLHEHATELAQLNLVGAWNQKSEADLAVLERMTAESYSTLSQKVRTILVSPGNPLVVHNGLWRVPERLPLWDSLGHHFLDQDLDTFRAIAVDALTERDPIFELAPEERFAASIHGKVLEHSAQIREGIAEGLALLGSRPTPLVNCSQNYAEITAVQAVREILKDADWKLWGSLNNLLPTLAEAAPNEFLSAVEDALTLSPCPFTELFAQEGAGVMGSNYLTGLLWALENLAWDESRLVRVSVILGELATHDPGGNWVNRPSNSLLSIFLPWYPQTTAPFDKRKVAVETLCKELPAVGWKLLVQLLPNQRQSTSGTHKPVWRDPIPQDWKPEVSHQDYWEQISFYAELAVSLAEDNHAFLVELVEHFDHLPQKAFDELLTLLSSLSASSISQEQRYDLWERLRRFTTKHRRYSDAKWSLDADRLSAIESVAKEFSPSSPLLLHKSLFSSRESDLYERGGDWDEQRKKLGQRRQAAIADILESGGPDAAIEFAKSSSHARLVGHFLGLTEHSDLDSFILPTYLESENQNLLEMARGYVGGRHSSHGFEWVDGLDTSGWKSDAVAELLSSLPFSGETWERVDSLLGKQEGKYWKAVSVFPYQTGNSLTQAVDKLIKYNRPLAAISCLAGIQHDQQALDIALCVRALLAVPESKEQVNQLDRYHIVDIIKYLQTAPGVSPDDLFQIEWAYLPLLDRDHEASPKFLESQLARSPEFFCEVIRSIFRSRKEGGARKEPSEKDRGIAKNALHLLDHWETLPGMQEGGEFDSTHFTHWLTQVKRLCEESGHLKVALLQFGEALIHAPSDTDGLWIHRTVAEALNDRETDLMRRGFRTALFNSRGFHEVDPTGKPEREFAQKYRGMAEAVENAGYQRFALVLRELAEDYERWAERVVAEHRDEI